MTVVSFVRIASLLGAFVLLAPAGASAQLFPVPSASTAPGGAVGMVQSGDYLIAPITFDGARLFRIAEPAADTGAAETLADRQTTIETVLGELTASITVNGRTKTAFAPASFKVTVVQQNRQTVLQAVDARHRGGLAIVTVTSTDAQQQGLTVEAVATAWQASLQTVIGAALLRRQPATVQHNIVQVERVALYLAVATAVAMVLLALLRSHVRRARAQLAARRQELDAQQQQGPEAEAQPHLERRMLLARALRAARPVSGITLLSSAFWALWWLLLLAWFGALVWGLGLFAQTAQIAHVLAQNAFAVIAVLIVAALVDRVGDITINRVADAYGKRDVVTTDEHTRVVLRVPTIAGAVSGFKTGLIVFVALLTILDKVGVPVGSVITIGGLVAVAVSLASQNFVRDFLNGFLVLFEDQYVLGDFITINGMTGLVERLTLRMVQIRDDAGSLITVPHSSVGNAVNHSRNWSRIDYRISIEPAADPQRAIEVLRKAIEEVAKDPASAGALHAPAEWVGIQAFSRDWTLVRASVKTAPLHQFTLRRALNERVRADFAAAQIGLGPPEGLAAS